MPRNRNRARQLPAHALGVLNWQREFWLLMVEHALSGAKGPPDISRLKGFGAPAPTQHTVTTPDQLHSFRKYNEGKSYHRQVRPFGFMVMFQQADDSDPSTVMRVIAPFNRDPTKAARKAFDRDTGEPVRPRQLKTYAAALRTYHNHPEAKFRNGERGDRGRTERRHIIAKSIDHIGKEANRLELQIAAGIDPQAQIVFDVDTTKTARLNLAAAAVRRLGSSRVAREAGLSRKHVSSIAAGGFAVTSATLSNIERVISSLEIKSAQRLVDAARLRSSLQAECERIGLRKVATALDINPSILSRIISGKRRISIELIRVIGPAIAALI